MGYNIPTFNSALISITNEQIMCFLNQLVIINTQTSQSGAESMPFLVL